MLLPIYFYMFFLLVRPQDWVPEFMGWPTAIITISIGLVLGLTQYLKDPKQFKIPQNMLLVFYLAVIFWATFISVDFYSAREQFTIYIKRVLVFFMVIWLVSTRARLINTIHALLVLCLFLAYQAILQGTTGESWGGLTPFPGYEEIRVRWYGDWDGPNVYALLFVIAFAVAVDYVLGTRNLFERIFGAICCITYTIAIYFTNSRGAFLALVVTLFFYVVSKTRSLKLLIVAPILLAPVLIFAPSRMSEVTSKESSARERTWLWEQGLGMLKENPFFGVGRGEFINRNELPLISHNNFVQNFSELGLIGFFCFMAILWFTFKGNYFSAPALKQGDAKLAGINHSMAALIVGYCATTFFIVMELDLLYFSIGLCTATYLVSRNLHSTVPSIKFTLKDGAIIFSAMIGIIAMVYLAAVFEIL